MALLNSFRMAGKRMLVHRSLLPKFLFLLALLLTTGRAMAQEMYAVFTNDGTLTFYYDNLRSTRTGDTYGMNTGDSTPGWQKDHASEITKAVFDASFADARPTSTAYWFAGSYEYPSLLKEIVGIEYLNTENVTSMSCMFLYCSSLTSLDVSNFNTANVTHMNYMFDYCSGLTSLDVSNFNTSNVTNMVSMFSVCSGLTSLDLSNFNTENVTDMSEMFSVCRGLTSLDVSSFNTANVTRIYGIFRGCSGLTSLDVSNFNTANVTNMLAMFSGCSGLTSLDVSNFNTANVTNMGRMFYGCYNLKTINSGEGWTTEKVTESQYMFNGCSNLVGGAGTVFDSNHVDVSYAHADRGTSNPGYLTDQESLTVPHAYAVFNEGTLTFYYDNLRSTRTGDTYNMNTGWSIPDWQSAHSSEIVKAVFDASFADARPTSTARWFYGSYTSPSLLKEIVGIEYLNTENVTYMIEMFGGCSGLTSLDVSNFNTSNVTDMNGMFSNCRGLTSLNVSNFNTENVTDMSGMFNGCSGLTSLSVSNFNTANVTDMYYLFQYCSGLTSLDISNFNTENVTNMDRMFRNCSGLASLDVSNFNTENVTDMSGMFNGCNNLKTIYCSKGWNTEKVTESQYMFSECYNLVGGAGTVFDSNHVDGSYAHADRGTSDPGYLTYNGSTYVVYNEGILTFYYDNLRSTRTGDTYDMNTGYGIPGWQNEHFGEITKAVFDASFADARPTSTASWFSDNYSSPSLNEIVGIEYLNTENVTNMSGMFSGCKSLTSLNVSNFNTENVTYMGSMFQSCSGLTSLDVSNFNTSNVTFMFRMFDGCSGLTSLDVSNFNTENVTDMRYMFYNCSNLTSLDVSNFNTEKVTSMYMMFSGCSGLTSLDVSNFNTANVTDMSDMFSGCRGLISLDVSNFNTANVTDMYGMFSSCSGLTSLDVSKFNTSNVTNMLAMFSYCSGLTSLDLSNFNTANVTNMEYMFSGCRGLTSLDVSNFNTANVTNMFCMFAGCSNLTSLDVSNFNTENVTKMESMFSGCSGLTSLDVSNFNTANVTDMYGMFSGCSGLTSLDVSNFNTANVTDMRYMFYNCSNLTSISLGDGMVNMPDFSTCLDLMEVNAYSKEPQAFASNCFADNVKENATLNVYVGTKPVYESTGGWNEFKNIVEKFIIPHNEENVSYGNGGEIDESTDLNGNTIGNIYYNIGSDNGEYNSTEGCITLTKAVSDEEISTLESENIFGDDFKNHYNGIVFMLQAGSGTIKVTAESVGNMTLKVKIGENEPITEELVGKTVSTFPYSVTEPTYVYIYGGASASGASPMHRAGPAENALKIYGIEWTESDTPSAIGTVREAAPTEDAVIYSLDGQRLQQTRKGINIVNGKKVVIK